MDFTEKWGFFGKFEKFYGKIIEEKSEIYKGWYSGNEEQSWCPSLGTQISGSTNHYSTINSTNISTTTFTIGRIYPTGCGGYVHCQSWQ